MMNNIDDYGHFTEDLWLSDDSPESLNIMSLGLAGETGEVMELLKKRLRDGTFDKKNFISEMGDVAYYWARLALAFGIHPSEILAANMAKLLDRKARGVMRGSGNDR